MMNYTRRFMLGVAAATMTLTALPAMAQDYPSKPVTIVVSYAAGGGTDAIARIFAARLEKSLGGRVIVENRPGAAANLGTDVAAKAQPDGYTLLIGNQGPMVVNPHIFKLRNDPVETLDPIAMIADAQLVVVAGPNLQVDTMQALLDKAKEGQLVYGSAGNASASHVATLLLGQTADVKLKHVPYKGAGPAINDLLGGHVDFMVTTVPSVIGLIQDGTLKALAVTGKERFPGLPDVPTVAEAALPTYSATAWYGLLGPKGLPQDVRDKLAAATQETLADPAFIESLKKDGGVPSHLVGQDFADFMAAERARWGEVVKAADIKVE
ncbi:MULTISPECIES: Bug family tripartite tricarboxylate transporter substrate binding protein [Paracoccus]|uniref:Bug family tripartite tricarboxylate transporter substrate binding protein n=1 Tax=Paracoccus TaxID=265 RepID=UPI0008E9645D|nr:MULTISPECIES: tripartite tricarboxylate transporter substrate binding protein [Paracoccus]MDF3856410.1 tripartite tricarboxylate transporter substrate binding protein [Paracoccus pantotrophus]SFP16622.1 Tripartite-type tricarboxylate transporter, receptor component TctC [Paracoccus pantotrophus]